ncbi:hypothetical protein PFISCL1PPCAC_24551 [Pristionchus fissidentatus]|uniref:C2H2-type domain-containing protein n=1 Tax=Pristionchus fissidentatus TaxID=1538716 RepID=A0AAV5WRC2_9BILA|nr:hypothetical protein PFISCL1PPCAC_24551 [Pristionchus fissidentatus]
MELHQHRTRTLCHLCHTMILRCEMAAHCRNHVETFHEAQPIGIIKLQPKLPCPFCQKVVFGTVSDVHYHMYHMHRPLLETMKPLIFCCKWCRLSFSTLRFLSNHWKSNQCPPGLLFDQSAADDVVEYMRELMEE